MRVVFAMLLGLALAGCAYHDQPLGSIKDPPRHLPISAAPPTALPKKHPCDCPDDRDSRGRRCGGRSACL